MKYVLDANNNPIDSDNDGVFDRVDAKGVAAARASLSDYESYTFRNFLYEGNIGRAYGIGGGKYSGSEEHTSELQSRLHLVCRLLLEKKKKEEKRKE